MKTKRWLAILLTLAMVFALSAPAFAAPAKEDKIPDTCIEWSPEATNVAAELMAGQDIPVGEVRIDATSEANEFIITYIVDEPWFLTEIHFEAISDTDENYIYSNGGLIPGSFKCKKSWDISEEVASYTFKYTAGAAVTGFAAHAVVSRQECTVIAEANDAPIVSDLTTMVTHGNTGAIEPFAAVESHPDLPLNNNVPYAETTWSGATASNGWTLDPDPDPMWIWEQYQVVHPTDGDIVTFEKTFDIPGTPIDSTLKIAVDNGYAVWVNGHYIGSDNLLEGFADDPERDTETEFRSALSALTQAYVDTTTWQSVGTFNIPATFLGTGSNTLTILAVNEYCNVGDGSNPYATNENGLNPGGLAFYLDANWGELTECNTISETAWGAGGDVAGGNWSMIIPRNQVPPGYKFIDQVDVQSENGIGVTTTAILENGKQYELRASGTFDYSSDIYDEADAEWFEKAGGWIKGETGVYADKTNVIDVSVNGDPVNDDWGDYNPTHEYTMDYTGTGSTLHLFIYDTNYTDNSGSIHVDIYEVLW